MKEFAKNTLSVAEKPSVSVEYSPTKQFCAITLSVILEPKVTVHPLSIVPLPMKTGASSVAKNAHSFIRRAPLIVVPVDMYEFVIS